MCQDQYMTECNDREEQRTANRRLAKKRVQSLNEALYFVSSSVLADSFALRNPLLRQAPNCNLQAKKQHPEFNNSTQQFKLTKRR